MDGPRVDGIGAVRHIAGNSGVVRRRSREVMANVDVMVDTGTGAHASETGAARLTASTELKGMLELAERAAPSYSRFGRPHKKRIYSLLEEGIFDTRKQKRRKSNEQKLFQVLEDILMSSRTKSPASCADLEPLIGKFTESVGPQKASQRKRTTKCAPPPVAAGTPSSVGNTETETPSVSEDTYASIEGTSCSSQDPAKDPAVPLPSMKMLVPPSRIAPVLLRQKRKRKIKTYVESSASTSRSPSGRPVAQAAAASLAFSVKKNGDSKTDKICRVCEKSGDIVRCNGGCHGWFHSACVPFKSESCFACSECATGQHSCFVCKSNDGEIRQCAVRNCRKHYHASCLARYRAARFDTRGTFTCPVHSCLSCVLNGNKKRASKGKMYRCIRCPVTYHKSELCVAAGSTILSSSVIVCPLHYQEQLTAGRHTQINVNWCFVCSQGGSLICCETCPASFHAECLNIEPPEGSYYCVECQSNVQPKYGDIVWVKLGIYRWWPAKVCSPKSVPINIQNVSHQPGEFPVRFFGTHDYHWTRRSRTFHFLEGDHAATHARSTTRLTKTFNIALEEAVEAIQKWKCAMESREAQNHERLSHKLPKYKHINANKPVGRAISLSVADSSQVTICDCDPHAENPCGSDSECINRLLLIECVSTTCPAGDRCQNQRFEKMQYFKAEVFRAEGKGWGLRSLEPIKKGQFVNEYVGEIIDEEECQLRMKKMHEENDTSYYFLTLDKDRIIDAGKKGNLSRFMNHSCQPNCELHKWTVGGDTRLGLFALCDIPVGTELTFNYNLDCLGNQKTICRCGAPNCSRFIGERPKTLVSTPQKKLVRPRRKKPKAGKEHENECFRCGFDGQLLLCDKKNCTKAYHLECLDLKKTPHNKWVCPWHHCDSCGIAATALCSTCPNSFCAEHDILANVRRLSDGTVLCHDHTAEQHLAIENMSRNTNSKHVNTVVGCGAVDEVVPTKDNKQAITTAALLAAGRASNDTAYRTVSNGDRIVARVAAIKKEKCDKTAQPNSSSAAATKTVSKLKQKAGGRKNGMLVGASSKVGKKTKNHCLTTPRAANKNRKKQERNPKAKVVNGAAIKRKVLAIKKPAPRPGRMLKKPTKQKCKNSPNGVATLAPLVAKKDKGPVVRLKREPQLPSQGDQGAAVT